ncbi:hypothetical protein [Agromyces sp. SYSU T00194]|uniref:hypothetical protein n=1 Tax=Agromyces chitinivorans TaxID=3158560 RepID=UPI00339AD56A
MLTTRTRGRAPAVAALLALGLALAGCSADASEDASAEAPDTAAEDATTEDSGGEASTGALLGTGDAVVEIDGVEHRFATDGADGRCEVLMGAALLVSMPLVEANGVEMPEGSGELTVEVPVDADDVEVVEAYAEVRVDGNGHWFAGAADTATASGVETPDMALTVDRDESGAVISGTQPMVPLVAGSLPDIDAVITVDCPA